MNRSKVYEWLLDNDCPFEWDVSDQDESDDQVTLIFTDKEQ